MNHRSFPLFYLIASVAMAEPPSRESVERLLLATQAETLIASTRQRIESIVKTTIEQSVRQRGANVADNAEARKNVELIIGKITAALEETLSWEAAKEVNIRVFTETFTQAEVNDLTAFYESPSGKAIAKKLPSAQEKAALLIQQRAAPLMKNLQQTLSDIKNATSDKAVTNNMRMLRAASDQYLLEQGVTSVKVSQIIGAGTFIKKIDVVAGETYPEIIEQGKAIVVRKADGSELKLE